MASEEMETLALNRLLITGPITVDTPTVVIEEIALTHGCQYESNLQDLRHRQRIIDEIRRQEVSQISKPFTRDVYPQLARFVNPRLQWRVGPLLEAMDFLLQFMNDDHPRSWEIPDVPWGLQTPETPRSLNACVVYRLAKHRGLRMFATTTFEEMASGLRMIQDPVPVLRERLTMTIGTLNQQQLVSLLMQCGVDPTIQYRRATESRGSTRHNQVVVYTQEQIDQRYRQIHRDIDSPGSQPNYQTLTPLDAIIWAAVRFRLDISKSSKPILELRSLFADRGAYIPIDPNLRPQIENLSLSQHFNPLFSERFYEFGDLLRMVHREGYQASDGSPYELLQMALLIDTFHHRLPEDRSKLTQEQTVIFFNDFDDLDPDLYLCYGPKDGPLVPFCCEELTGSFRQQQSFMNPIDRERQLFDEAPIRKLDLLARDFSTDHSKPETVRQQYRELHEAIESVRANQRLVGERGIQFQRRYQQSDSSTQEKVRDALTRLMEMGFYMRGWLGPGNNYPIREAPIIDSGEAVDLRAAQSIGRFTEACEAAGQLGAMILDLPLLRWTRTHFEVSNGENLGLTIRDRITIITENRTIQACIRMSSNWFVSSAHRYMSLIGMVPDFQLDHQFYSAT